MSASFIILQSGITGDDFLGLTREDIALLFPKDFMVGKRLSKYIASFDTTLSNPPNYQPTVEGSSSPESTVEISPSTTPTHVQKATPAHLPESSQTTPTTSRKHAGGPCPPSFTLPKYDAVLERRLAEDSFYDPTAGSPENILKVFVLSMA